MCMTNDKESGGEHLFLQHNSKDRREISLQDVFLMTFVIWKFYRCRYLVVAVNWFYWVSFCTAAFHLQKRERDYSERWIIIYISSDSRKTLFIFCSYTDIFYLCFFPTTTHTPSECIIFPQKGAYGYFLLVWMHIIIIVVCSVAMNVLFLLLQAYVPLAPFSSFFFIISQTYI